MGEYGPTGGFWTSRALPSVEQGRLQQRLPDPPPHPSPSPTPHSHPPPPTHTISQSPGPDGSREIRATERSGPFQIGIRYRLPGSRHCRARSPSAQAAEAEAVAVGWPTPTSPRCPGPLATTARICSPRSRRASRGETRTRRRRRSSLISTAAAPMALKCIVFFSWARDEVGGGKSAGGPRPNSASVEDKRPRAVGDGRSRCSRAAPRPSPPASGLGARVRLAPRPHF